MEPLCLLTGLRHDLGNNVVVQQPKVIIICHLIIADLVEEGEELNYATRFNDYLRTVACNEEN